MIDWSYAPSPSEKLDFYTITVKNEINFISCVFIKIEDAHYESGTYITPAFYEPWEVEILVVRPIMKCWGRGLKK